MTDHAAKSEAYDANCGYGETKHSSDIETITNVEPHLKGVCGCGV